MYAECFVRGAGGNGATALGYVNAVRTRANGATINAGGLTMDFILDERARNCWEGHRRTDLVRFGKFTGELFMALERWSCWRPTQSFRDIFLFQL
jgi:hypothetical protein